MSMIMSDSQWQQLQKQISHLEGAVDKGFENVNSRLDTLNGKVAQHEKRLNDGEHAIENNAHHRERMRAFYDKWIDRVSQWILALLGIGLLWALVASNVISSPL